MNNRLRSLNSNKKIIIIIALVCVLSVSIGFALFSGTLVVKSGLSVNPVNAFSVVFSSNPDKLETKKITPTVSSDKIEAEQATIDNSGTYPTITNLTAKIQSPGDSVTYKFYALNTGKYNAFLTTIAFQNLINKSIFKECVANESLNQELLNNACGAISATVTVGDITTKATKTGIENHMLAPGESEVVTVTLSYSDTAERADGSFEVNFGDIYLVYATQEGFKNPIANTNKKPCELADANGNNKVDVGEVVTCGTESFYVMPDHEKATSNTVSMLTMYNLNVGDNKYPNEETFGLQDEHAKGRNQNDTYGTVPFSNIDYWGDAKNKDYIYDNRASISAYVNEYSEKLKKMGLSDNTIAILPSLNQYEQIGCNNDGCSNAPSWAYSTFHWLGNFASESVNDMLYTMDAYSGFIDISYFYNDSTGCGVRPVVIIPEDDIELMSNSVNAIEYITKLYHSDATVVNNGITYNIDTTNGIIDDGLGGTVSSGGNLRYYGANPDNYIDIGDRDASGNPILWRIIGIFKNVEVADDNGNVTGTEDLIKVIRNESIGAYAWHQDESILYTHNDWPSSTLQTMLNGAYYNSTKTSYYEYYTGDGLAKFTVDFTNEGLSSEAKNKTANVLWNLGGHTTSDVYSNDMYRYERGTEPAYGGVLTDWLGKIGLMYPSDYGYATDFTKCSENLGNYSSDTDSYACRSNNWIYKQRANMWTLTSNSNSVSEQYRYNKGLFAVRYSGAVSDGYYSYGAEDVRPVLYLKSNVSIIGEGTTSDGINYKKVG